MTDYPISEEALEATRKSLEQREQLYQPWHLARTAINAFLAAEGFEVEERRPISHAEAALECGTFERLVGPWRPSEGQ